MPSSKEKFALLAYVAQANSVKGHLGKKAFQKLIHITSDLFDVSLGYKFKLYTYGPFSRELAGDLDLLDKMGVLAINFDAVRNGYEIRPTEKAGTIISGNSEFIHNIKKSVDFVSSKFGGKLAKELELYSMILFIFKNGMTDLEDDEAIATKFLEIKPHYDRAAVLAGIGEIRDLLSEKIS